LLKLFLAIVFISSLAGVCTAYVGLLTGNDADYRVGMVLAAPCYLLMAFLGFCMVRGEFYAVHPSGKPQPEALDKGARKAHDSALLPD
jgi:hypothetical protein